MDKSTRKHATTRHYANTLSKILRVPTEFKTNTAIPIKDKGRKLLLSKTENNWRWIENFRQISKSANLGL